MYQTLFPLFAGLSAALAIGTLAYLDQLIPGSLWLMAPFGATTVLVFALPQSLLAQPRNVIFGHLLAAAVGLVFVKFVGVYPWSLALATGLAITLMMLTKTVHPPAGANPVLIMLLNPGWEFLITPVLVGAVIIAAIGYLINTVVAKKLQ
ncbi:MAG: HPP family protein [Pseudomonadales bacterium]